MPRGGRRGGPGVAERQSDRNRGRYLRLRKMLMTNWRAQRARCWFCGGEVDWTARHPDPRSPELHHLVPVSVAPQLEWDPTNMKLSHRLCNSLGQAAFGPTTIRAR